MFWAGSHAVLSYVLDDTISVYIFVIKVFDGQCSVHWRLLPYVTSATAGSNKQVLPSTK